MGMLNVQHPIQHQIIGHLEKIYSQYEIADSHTLDSLSLSLFLVTRILCIPALHAASLKFSKFK